MLQLWLLSMRLTRAKLFIRKSPFGCRDYFVLRLRHLFSQSPYVLYLSYDGLSSPPLNQLRALAVNYDVRVQLLLRRWASSIFLFTSPSRMPFECRLLVLHSADPKNLLALTQDSLFSSLVKGGLPFFAHSYGGLLSQQAFFPFLLEAHGERLLVFLLLLQYQLLPIIYLSLELPLYLLSVLALPHQRRTF